MVLLPCIVEHSRLACHRKKQQLFVKRGSGLLKNWLQKVLA
jgi:hypothetical protein